MNNTVELNGLTFEISTTVKNNGIEIGLALESINEVIRELILKDLPLKKEALKYCRHSKKSQQLVKWVNKAEEYLKLESPKKA